MSIAGLNGLFSPYLNVMLCYVNSSEKPDAALKGNLELNA